MERVGVGRQTDRQNGWRVGVVGGGGGGEGGEGGPILF